MRKLTFISISAITLAAGFVSCGKADYSVEDDRIAFDVAVGVPGTKAGTSTYEGAAFGCYAWKTSGTWASTAASAKLSNPYMVNAQTTKTGAKWYPESFRWPSSATYLHFACYSPYKASSPMSFDLTDGICFTGYEIDYSKAAEDLLYSDLSLDNSNTKVSCPIVFHHALSQIQVNLQTDNIPSGLASTVTSAVVTLKSLSVSGLKNTGNFVQSPSPAWSAQSGSASYTLFSGSKELSTTTDSSCPAFYVIPQAFEAGVQAINLNYDVSISYSNGKTATKNGISETHYFSDLSLTNGWERGKQVIYTVTISAFGEELSFSASTEDWAQSSISGDLGGGYDFN